MRKVIVEIFARLAASCRMAPGACAELYIGTSTVPTVFHPIAALGDPAVILRAHLRSMELTAQLTQLLISVEIENLAAPLVQKRKTARS